MPTLDLGDITLAYEEHGADGVHPPLLLVHGYTGSKLDWVDVVGPLSTDRRVIAYDHRGHGESTNTGDAATYTFDQLDRDLECFVDGIGLDRFGLLGHSMGGILAMRYVLAHPERVHSLVLMDTGAEMTRIIPEDFVESIFQMAQADGMRAVAEQFAKYSNATPEMNERLVWKFERLDPVAFKCLANELSTYPSLVDRLGEIACTCTVIVGENDTGLRPAADLLASKIAAAPLEVIPDAAHSPQDENGAEWLAAVRRHLARADAS